MDAQRVLYRVHSHSMKTKSVSVQRATVYEGVHTRDVHV